MHCIAIHHPGVQCLTITVNRNHLTPHFVFVKYKLILGGCVSAPFLIFDEVISTSETKYFSNIVSLARSSIRYFEVKLSANVTMWSHVSRDCIALHCYFRHTTEQNSVESWKCTLLSKWNSSVLKREISILHLVLLFFLHPTPVFLDALASLRPILFSPCFFWIADNLRIHQW